MGLWPKTWSGGSTAHHAIGTTWSPGSRAPHPPQRLWFRNMWWALGHWLLLKGLMRPIWCGGCMHGPSELLMGS
ncbi:hypothetical protein JHK84_031780 [Glycine max]|nr:hypothetical protein JHK84_031780 [Glycine max]